MIFFYFFVTKQFMLFPFVIVKTIHDLFLTKMYILKGNLSFTGI